MFKAQIFWLGHIKVANVFIEIILDNTVRIIMKMVVVDYNCVF